jgi:hypothetical protein
MTWRVARLGCVPGFLMLALVFARSEASDTEVVMPEKTEWKLHDGTTIRGKAYDFGYQLCYLQRRRGKLLLNGAEVEDATSQALLKALCEEYGVPVNDEKELQKRLAKQRFAQAILPYYTLRYHDLDTGADQQLPTILLAGEEKASLRPVFEQWLAKKLEEHQEAVKRAQEIQNQRAMLAMQAAALDAQRSMAKAAQKNADANKKAADELEKLNKKVK